MFIFKNIIERPALDLIDDVVISCSTLNASIENFAMSDYILDSLLLKLTGFHEQKFKLLMWEIATLNGDTRKKFSKQEKPYDRMGEYSQFKVKNTIYKSLVNQILYFKGDLDEAKSQRAEILSLATECIIQKFDSSVLSAAKIQQFSEYKVNYDNFHFRESQILSFANDGASTLLQSSLQSIYDDLIDHRNKIAHNTFASRVSSPSLNMLSDKPNEHGKGNYFAWIGVIVLVDEIIIRLYRILIECSYKSPDILEML